MLSDDAQFELRRCLSRDRAYRYLRDYLLRRSYRGAGDSGDAGKELREETWRSSAILGD
jgi:hypothetical protein